VKALLKDLLAEAAFYAAVALMAIGAHTVFCWVLGPPRGWR
jgi:hypothetical protein